jgi:hypothetical protein
VLGPGVVRWKPTGGPDDAGGVPGLHFPGPATRALDSEHMQQHGISQVGAANTGAASGRLREHASSPGPWQWRFSHEWTFSHAALAAWDGPADGGSPQGPCCGPANPPHSRLHPIPPACPSPQVVLEGGSTNSSVTSPAAALALTLMYLKTNDASIAARLRVPGTTHGLGGVRPHMVMLRVLGRALVMWNTIAPTSEWLAEQLPALLQGPLHKLLDRLQAASATAASSGAPGAPQGAEVAAAAAAGPGVAGTGGANALAVAQAQVHALAGACLAIGLRFAGSGSARAEALLRHHALQLLAAKRGAAPLGEAGGPAGRCRLDKHLLEGCLDSVVVALGLVMAGSGHMPTLRLLQHLRWVHSRGRGGACCKGPSGRCTHPQRVSLPHRLSLSCLRSREASLGRSRPPLPRARVR